MKELITALNAFQAELVKVNKDSDNPFYKSKYADLASIMLATQPVLTKHGLAISQSPVILDGHMTGLKTRLMHISGEMIEETMPLYLPKDDPQGQGSAITYARRYSYASILQIVIGEDDDANRTVGSRTIDNKHTPASDKQRSYITTLLQMKGVDSDSMVDYVSSNFGIELIGISAEDASSLISKLSDK